MPAPAQIKILSFTIINIAVGDLDSMNRNSESKIQISSQA